MEIDEDPPKLPTTTTTTSIRYKCAACYKQYNKKEHLIEHMKTSYHSIHQPKCEVCKKHCKSFESLREHITGPLCKTRCSRIFAERGCDLCMRLFDSSEMSDTLREHRELCCLPAPAPVGKMKMLHLNSEINISASDSEIGSRSDFRAVALDCEMVGGGSDGSLDLCARVCLVDENENLVFHSYVLPQIPVTDYRYEITGITEEQLRDAMPLKEVQDKVRQILYNGESSWQIQLDGGKARVLVGHNLEHDLDCLRLNYPDHLLRDTAKYRPLMKTNLVSHSLKYLTKTYLGYDIQLGIHDPYEDCVSVMRLYKRMRSQDHQVDGIQESLAAEEFQTSDVFSSWNTANELEKMNPDELFRISRSDYRCWCLDSLRA